MPRIGEVGWQKGRYVFSLIVPPEVHGFLRERAMKEAVPLRTIVVRSVLTGLAVCEEPTFDHTTLDLGLGLRLGQDVRARQTGEVWLDAEDGQRVVAIAEKLRMGPRSDATIIRILLLMGLKTIYGWTMAQALQPAAV